MAGEEDFLEKTGAELFRELLRVYEVAELDDYFKAGKWRDETMKCDLLLLHAHRKEAGAPDPIPLEEVVMPELPKTGLFTSGARPSVPLAASLAAAARPGLAVARPVGRSPVVSRPLVVAQARP